MAKTFFYGENITGKGNIGNIKRSTLVVVYWYSTGNSGQYPKVTIVGWKSERHISVQVWKNE